MDVKPLNRFATGSPSVGPDETGSEEREESAASFAWFLFKLVMAVLIFRSFVFAPFTIPSESMLPRLWNGDYLLAAKWPYGYSSHSLPFGAPLIPGRIFASAPERGDIVIFKHPIDGTDYIKRVIALPGDTVEMVGGKVVLNGEMLPRERIEDFVQPLDQAKIDAFETARTTNPLLRSPCGKSAFEDALDDGSRQCRYPQYRETLPGGVSYNVLDFGPTQFDFYPPNTIGEGEFFVLGDNRDNSRDSRFEARAGDAVGIVPQNKLVGQASIIVWSTDGSAQWIKPWTWFTAARWGRMGTGL